MDAFRQNIYRCRLNRKIVATLSISTISPRIDRRQSPLILQFLRHLQRWKNILYVNLKSLLGYGKSKCKLKEIKQATSIRETLPGPMDASTLHQLIIFSLDQERSVCWPNPKKKNKKIKLTFWVTKMLRTIVYIDWPQWTSNLHSLVHKPLVTRALFGSTNVTKS